MAKRHYALLENRGIIAIVGEDARSFLQGLISNDVEQISANRSIYSALLTPQGKFLHDFFASLVGDEILLDCESKRADDLRKRLSMYKLRSKVTITDRSGEFSVAAIWGDDAAAAFGLDNETGTAAALGSGIVYVDPRLAEAGLRALLPRGDGTQTLIDAGLKMADFSEYDNLRLTLGLADGSRDMVPEKATLLENGFDELNGVDWNKGCYMGQELTARTKYRGLVKKRLVPVAINGPMPQPGTPIMLDDREAGEMRSAQGSVGLALMRLDAMEKATSFKAGDADITPEKPAWAIY